MAEKASGAVDFAYLEAYMAGDRAVIAEVLALFAQQASGWSPRLEAAADDWRDIVHTIKGAARGVGASGLGELCARAEEVGASELPGVQAELARVLAAIAAYRPA